MVLEIRRRIRDNVHGTIDVSTIEDLVMAHPWFQRLRRIKQTAFLSYVFPGATHSRFEHSLGVMHLAGLAWDKIRTNQKRIEDILARKGCSDNAQPLASSMDFQSASQILKSDYHLQVLRLAALMHDLGHAPFSHSGERFLPPYIQVLEHNPNMSFYLKTYLEKSIERGHSNRKVRHEIFSALIIDGILSQISSQSGESTLQVDPRDVVAVLIPEVGLNEGSRLQSQDSFLVLHELISGELDIDRMDYLIRDAKECGVVYGVFDAGRILDGLCFYVHSEYKSIHLGLNRSSLAAFEDYLRARQSMYMQVYFHKTSNSAEAMMKQIADMIPEWTLPPCVQDYVQMDDSNIGPQLKTLSSRLSQRQGDYFLKLVRNLLMDRCLWKSVMEVVGSSQAIPAKMQSLFNQYKSSGKNVQILSSANVLTRFDPQTKATSYPNMRVPLKLVVRTDEGHFIVENIEDHSFMYKDPQPRVIHRLYVDFDA